MMHDPPATSLASIAHLLQATSTPALSPRLAALLQQRTLSLLHMQRSLRALTLQRDSIGALLAAHATSVEDSLAVDGAGAKLSRKTSRGAGGKKDTEGAFIEKYDQLIGAFEKSWDGATREFEANEILTGAPRDWIEELDDSESANTVYELLEVLLADPYTLGAGIATLEGSALTSLIPSASSSGDVPPLESLMKLITAVRGPEVTLQLALGTFETATREIIGRENSAQQQQATFGVGLGLGIGVGMGGESRRTAPPPTPGGQAREKELEGFLVQMLELLDGLGLQVDSLASSLASPSSSIGTGPLALHRGVEDILLDLLHSARALRQQSTSPKPPQFVPATASPTDSPIAPSPSTFSPSTWGSTMTTTLSSLSALPMAGLSTLASGAATVTGINLPSSPLPPASPTTPPPPPNPRDPPPLPPKPGSPPLTFPAFIPSSPSQFLAPPRPPSPISSLLWGTATALLRTLTPAASVQSSIPLPQALIARLLSTSFPVVPGSSEGSAAHRKILLLTVVRWWAFGWLGRKLGRAAYGGAWTTAKVPSGVGLSLEGGRDVLEGAAGAAGSAGTALLDEVYISNGETVELMLGLHRTVYAAIVSACGLSGSSFDETHISAERDKDKRALAKAARAFVAAWRESPSASATAPHPTPAPTLSATSLSSDEFLALVNSFAPLVLHKPASSPRPPLSSATRGGRGSSSITSSPPSASFKRSSAFGWNSFPQLGGGGFGQAAEGTGRATKAAEVQPGLVDRVEELQRRLQETPTRGEGDSAVLFATERGAQPGAIKLSASPPPAGSPLSSSTPPLPSSTPPSAASPSVDSPSLSTPKARTAPFARPQTSPPPSLRPTELASGWVSPPLSPRTAALRHSMEARSSAGYFASQQMGALSAGSGTLDADDPFLIDPTEASSPQAATAAELELLRRGIFALAGTGLSRRRTHRPAAASLAQEIMDALKVASTRAVAERDYPTHILFSQTLAVLQHHQRSSADLSTIIGKLLDPLKEEFERRQKEERLAIDRLQDLEVQRQGLLETARSERGLVNDLRVRAWYSSIKGSQLGRQLRNRLAEVHGRRTPFEQEHARNSLETWRKDLGIHSFTKVQDSTFDESLMLVETAIALSTQPSTFYANQFWSRERAVVAILVAQRTQDSTARPSLAESLLGAGSSLLAAPLSLAGLPYTASTSNTNVASEPNDPQIPFDIILSFGAASPSLLKSHEASLPFSGAVEDHLLRLQLKLASYLWSDLSSTVVAPRDEEGRLIGCDAWFEEFASPLSPLPRPEEGEVPLGVKAVPKAYLPSTPPPASHLVDLITRFSVHPSPHAKMHALLELELVLAATMSAPASAHAIRPAPVTLDRSKDHLVKLNGLLQSRAKRTSITISPLNQLMEEKDEITDGGNPEKVPSLTDAPRRRSLSRPISLASSTSDIPSLLPSLLDFSSSSSAIDSSAAPASGFLANTDELLLTLESLLLHTLPNTPALFQTLQVIASLTPPSLLDFHPLGKAFIDFSGAALSIKREVVEGEFGVMERGMKALSEGTTEGRELAERLIRIAAGEGSAVALGILGSIVAS